MSLKFVAESFDFVIITTVRSDEDEPFGGQKKKKIKTNWIKLETIINGLQQQENLYLISFISSLKQWFLLTIFNYI